MVNLKTELPIGFNRRRIIAMTFIELKNVTVDFPIYNASNRSIKNKLINFSTGGKIKDDKDGYVIVRALDQLNLKIKNGERVAILGHNGAGKSTFLRLINQIYHPSSGIVSIKGQVGSLINISLGIDPEATGRENIIIRANLLGLSKSLIRAQFDEVVEFSEIANFIDMPLRTYSSGMHMRLAFAVATMVRPEILLMDEWLSVGDDDFKKKAQKRILSVVKATHILILASHARDEIMNICNRAIWLEQGQIVMDDTPESVCNRYFKKKTKSSREIHYAQSEPLECLD